MPANKQSIGNRLPTVNQRLLIIDDIPINLEVLGATLLGVYGIWQSEGSVRHLVAKRLVDLSHMMGRLDTSSRNFC